MFFKGNKWNEKKLVSYQNMLQTIEKVFSDVVKIPDADHDTTKVCLLLIFLASLAGTSDIYDIIRWNIIRIMQYFLIGSNIG